MKQMVTFTDPGLYAVYIGEMVGQFSDGYWENSRNKDWHHFGYYNAILEDVSESSGVPVSDLPKIRYNINGFFSYVKKEDIKCIITRVLMLYRNRDLVEQTYRSEGKDEADSLIHILDSAESIRDFGGNNYQKEAVKLYFGSMERFCSLIPEVTEESIKEFTRIGKMLHNSFSHVRKF